MVELREASERRQHRREAVARPAFAQKGAAPVRGLLQDISASGARFALSSSPASRHDFVPGDTITITLDGTDDEVIGRVTRIAGAEVAITFDGFAPARPNEIRPARGDAED